MTIGESRLDQLTTIQLVAVWIIPILFAITLHEAAHGYVAHKFGDDTAFVLGRVSANPIKHIDLVGTIIIPCILLLTTKLVFGWAKPVPVNSARLRNPRRDMILVALAGPTSNLLMAIFWAVILKVGIMMASSGMQWAVYIAFVGQAGVIVNLLLGIFNLFPIPPLDGSRVLTSFLPSPWDQRVERAAPLGLIIILGLALYGVLTPFIVEPMKFLQGVLFSVLNIH
jgi:Zn-dependent protease